MSSEALTTLSLVAAAFDRPTAPDALKAASDSIERFVRAHGPLRVKVDPSALSSQTDAEASVPCASAPTLHRGGLLSLTFWPGVTPQELGALAALVASDADEDLAAMLWAAKFPHLETVWALPPATPATEALLTSASAFLGSAEGSLSRYERPALPDSDATEATHVASAAPDAALKARLQADIEAEERARLFPKLFGIFFRMLEFQAFSSEEAKALVARFLDATLARGDLTGPAQLLHRLGDAGSNPKLAPLVEALTANVHDAASERARLNRAVKALLAAPTRRAVDAGRYFAAAKAAGVQALLEASAGERSADELSGLTDALVHAASSAPDIVQGATESDDPKVFGLAAQVVERLQLNGRSSRWDTVLASRPAPIRACLVRVLGQHGNGGYQSVLVTSLKDTSGEVAVAAAETLARYFSGHAAPEILAVMVSEAFSRRPADEQRRFAAALGRTGAAQAFTHFTQSLEAKVPLFGRGKVLEEKMLALAGLEGSSTLQALKVLQHYASDSQQNADIRAEAQAAAERVKTRLTGGRP